MIGNRETVERLFAAAIELSNPAERAAFLDRECGGDEALRAEIESLLVANSQASAFLEHRSRVMTGSSISFALPAEKSGDRIDRYKLLEKIGEGGFGDVWMAEQEHPVRRRVALKIIKLGMDTKEVMARFEAERQALALMDHPNIARMFDGGATATGRPYFVMELVRGIAITKFCDEHQLTTNERLELFTQICHAIQQAHQKGIIHRDLKPSNILVGIQDDRPVVKVIDFGIAKATDIRLTEKTLFTNFQQFIGTPAYMSPEQAGLGGLDIDTRTDIYALGVLLYELLTGRQPFETSKLLERGYDAILQTIREIDPPKPSTRLSTLNAVDLSEVARRRRADAKKLSRLVRGDLDWIVMKCLEKDRARRYATANGLALDLKRFLEGDAVLARPPSNFYRLERFVRRNRTLATAGAVAMLALLLGSAVSTWQAVRATNANRAKTVALHREAQARTRAEQSEILSRKFLYAADINLAQQALAANNIGRARRLLERHRPQAAEEDLRHWEWRYLWQQVKSDSLFSFSNDLRLVSIALSPDNRFVASGGWADTPTRVWNLRTRQLHFEIPYSKGERAVAFSPKGDMVAAAGSELKNYFTSLWDLETGRELGRLPTRPPGVFGLAFSPGGSVLATRTGDSVELWDAQSKAKLNVFSCARTGTGFGGVIVFSADSKLLAVGGERIELFDWVLGKRLLSYTWDASWDQILALAISPDNKWLASGTGYNVKPIRILDAMNGNLITNLFSHHGWVSGLAFSPNGQILASSSADQMIRLWDTATWQQITTLKGHMDEVHAVTYSTDGSLLASPGRDGSIHIWPGVPQRQEPYRIVLRDVKLLSNPLCFSPSGKYYAYINTNDAISVCDSVTGGKRSFQITNALGVAFSPKGELIVESVENQKKITLSRIHVIDPESQKKIVELPSGGIGMFALSTSGKTFTTACLSTNVWLLRRWNTETWRELAPVAMPGGLNPRLITLSDTVLVYGRGHGFVNIIEIESGMLLKSFRVHPEQLSGVALSPDGTLLAASSEIGTAKIWDIPNDKERLSIRANILGVYSVAFSPDGRRLATGGSWKEAIKLWDISTGQEVATLEGEGHFVDQVIFSHDSRTLAALTHDGTVNLWRAPSWGDIEELQRQDKSAKLALPTHNEAWQIALSAAVTREQPMIERLRAAGAVGPSVSDTATKSQHD